MSIDAVLKHEIRRITKREMKPVVESLQAMLRAQKSEITGLKQALRQQKSASRVASAARAPVVVEEGAQFRFSAGRLAQLREKKDLTQAELAQLLQTSVPTLIKWLKGEGRPAPIQLARIAWVRSQGKRALRRALESQA